MIEIGDVFGRLIVESRAASVRDPRTGKPRSAWVCLCECGAYKTVRANCLQRGMTKSCGCFRREVTSARSVTHGKSGSLIYKIWASMLDRCNNPNAHDYLYYGGRGVTVCDRWLSFYNFYSDMGESPEGLTIDRVDNESGYCLTNCRWATREQQARNRGAFKTSTSGILGIAWRVDHDRFTARITANGVRHNLGSFTDFFEACCARKSAENRLWVERDELI